MKGQDTVKLAGLLVQCPALEHLDLSGNSDFGAGRVERFAGVMVKCSVMTHLNLCNNQVGSVGGGRFRSSWTGQDSDLVLEEVEEEE